MTAKIKSLAVGGSNYKNKPRGVSDRAFAKVYWPYLPLVLIAGAILSFGAQTGTLQAAVTKHHSHVLDYATSMSASNLLADTNADRAQNGVAALTLNSQLDAAAQGMANDMVARDYWSHYAPNGNPPWVWVDAQGYAYQALAQNLATGFTDEQATIDGWMASPDHRANMLNPIYKDVGFAFANDPNYTAAGGGPMTIIVAFYGEPPTATVAANPTAPTSSTPISTGSTTPTGTTAAIGNTTNDSQKPGVTLAYRTSKAQLAFARLPQSSFVSGLVIFVGLLAAGLWLSRHALAFRRVLVNGEEFVVRHPLIYVGLLTIAAISFMLSQTAGFIQ